MLIVKSWKLDRECLLVSTSLLQVLHVASKLAEPPPPLDYSPGYHDQNYYYYGIYVSTNLE